MKVVDDFVLDVDFDRYSYAIIRFLWLVRGIDLWIGEDVSLSPWLLWEWCEGRVFNMRCRVRFYVLSSVVHCVVWVVSELYGVSRVLCYAMRSVLSQGSVIWCVTRRLPSLRCLCNFSFRVRVKWRDLFAFLFCSLCSRVLVRFLWVCDVVVVAKRRVCVVWNNEARGECLLPHYPWFRCSWRIREFKVCHLQRFPLGQQSWRIRFL